MGAQLRGMFKVANWFRASPAGKNTVGGSLGGGQVGWSEFSRFSILFAYEMP